MNKFKTLFTSLMSVAILCVCAAAAQAQGTQPRTWVATTGTDSATCGPRNNPCATWQRAHDNAAIGGEVNAADRGDFGQLVINKAITIDGLGAGAAITALNAGVAITVNAPAPNPGLGIQGALVIIRNLTLTGLQQGHGTAPIPGAGNDGIQFNSGAALVVQNCDISSFRNAGINYEADGNTKFYISDAKFYGNYQHGVRVKNDTNGTVVDMAIAGTKFEANGFLTGSGAALNLLGNTIGTVRDSVLSGNAFGVYASPDAGLTSGILEVSLDEVIISNNQYGVYAGFSGTGTATVRFSNVMLQNNKAIGMSATAGSFLVTYGNNRCGPGQCAFNSTIPQQ